MKLTDKNTWFKPKNREEEEALEKGREENKNGKIQMRIYKKMKGQEEGAEPGRGPSDIKSFMFCPYTPRGCWQSSFH